MVTLRRSAIDKAQGDLNDAQALQARWSAEAAARAAELADLEARAGDEVLADETAAGRLSEQMAGLRSAVRIAEQAAAAAARNVEPAQRAVRKAEAASLRARSAEVRGQAAKRQERTDRLLAELLEHEGTRYVPYVPDRVDVAQAGAAGIAGVGEPTTQAMLAEADELDRQALVLEMQGAEQEILHTPCTVATGAVQIVGTTRYRDGQVSAAVTPGTGSVTFEVADGSRTETFVLPDADGGRSRALTVGLSPKGGELQLLADGTVIAGEAYDELTASL